MVKSKQPIAYATVTRSWHGETVVCIAGGPSLTQADVDACRGRARVLAIKDAIRLAPDADVLYACDEKWWRHHAAQLAFSGPRYALEMLAARYDVEVLKNTGDTGLELSPDGLKTGRNSGYQAINLAVHLGATRVLLLGYDMGPRQGQHHWFGPHPYPASAPPYDRFLQCFDTIVAPLAAAGVQVVNCTPDSSLRCFPTMRLAEALAAQEALA